MERLFMIGIQVLGYVYLLGAVTYGIWISFERHNRDALAGWLMALIFLIGLIISQLTRKSFP